MGGHVLWLDSGYIIALEQLVALLSDGKRLSIEDVKRLFEPVTRQSALREQHGIMREMELAGIDKKEIASLFGYDEYLVNEILALDWNEEYDYSQFVEMKTIS